MRYTPPSFLGNAFNCPYSDCRVYGFQEWQTILFCGRDKYDDEFSYAGNGYNVSKCPSCMKHAFWYEEYLIYPTEGALEIPEVNKDMPDSAKADYIEACTIATKSPRSSAALLRLAIEKICTEKTGKKESLNSAIGTLYSDRVISVTVKESLDILRLTGNNAVHPGLIDTENELSQIIFLFNLVNEIVEDLYTRPRRKREHLNQFPQTQLNQIAKRDCET